MGAAKLRSLAVLRCVLLQMSVRLQRSTGRVSPMKQHQIPHPWTDYNIAKNLDSPDIGRLWTGLIETYRRKCHSGLNLLVVELRNIVDGVIVVSHHFECNN